MYASGWSDLHTDLLAQILERLELLYFIRCGAVCGSWRSALTNRLCLPKPQIPWLLLSSPDKKESRYFFSLTEENIYEIRLPEISGRHFVGSSEGFLISVDELSELHALNPLTRTHIPLPSTAYLPGIDGVVRDPSSGELTDYLVWTPSSTGPELGPEDVEFMRNYYYHKAIVSPSGPPHTVVVIQNGFSELAFAQAGDLSWTPLQTSLPPPGFCDILFRKGRLHALHYMGQLAVFDLDGNSLPMLVSDRPLPDAACSMRYLVESPKCGEDLFQVYRHIEFFDMDGNREGDGDDNDDNKRPVHRTMGFRVFKLDESKYEWTEVNCMGKLAVFLGFNSSIAISTTDFPKLRSNCIYFTDDYIGSYMEKPYRASDLGVFDLGDRSIKPLNPSDDLQQLNWPPPIWFTPIQF